MDKHEFKRTVKNAGIIGIMGVLAAIIGFLLQSLIAYYFGANKATDAFITAQYTSELLSKILLGGSVVAVLIPIFLQKKVTEGKESAWKLALTIIHCTGILYIVLIAIVGIFTTPFVHSIAPGFAPDTAQLTINLLRIMIPAFFLLFIVDLGSAILQAVQHFSTPSSLRVIAPIVSVLSLVTLAPAIGIYSLAVGAVIGALIQVSLIFFTLRRQGFVYRLYWDIQDPAVKKLLLLVLPFIFSMLATVLAGVIYRRLGSFLEPGSLTAIRNAEKITQLLSYIFLGSITTAVYPVLSEKVAKGDPQQLLPTLASAIRLVFFASLPLAIGPMLLSVSIIKIAYEHGKFTPENTHATAVALFFLSIGLLTNTISSLFGNATLAIQRTKASVAVTIISQIISIILFVILTPRMGLAGLALASSLGPIFIAAMYIFYLRRHIPNILSVFWHTTYLKALFLISIMAVVVYNLNQLEFLQETPTLVRAVAVAAVGAIIYLGGAHVLKIPEMNMATELFGDKWRSIKQKFL